jgi:hypothetical protein
MPFKYNLSGGSATPIPKRRNFGKIRKEKVRFKLSELFDF